jgi:hypothetical protein
MELNRVVYKNNRIIEFKNESKNYVSTFKIISSEGKCLSTQKARNSVLCLNYCKKIIDNLFS